MSKPLPGEVRETRDGERSTQPLAVVRGVDPDDVDLAGGFRRAMVIVGVVMVLHAGVVVVMPIGIVMMVHAGIVVDLGPAETGDTTFHFMNEESVRVEPWRRESFGENDVVPIALFGVSGKGATVHLQPLVVVESGSKGSRGESVRDAMSCIQWQVAAHQQQRNIGVEVVSGRARLLDVGGVAYEPADGPATRRVNAGYRRVELVGRHVVVASQHPSAIYSRDVNVRHGRRLPILPITVEPMPARKSGATSKRPITRTAKPKRAVKPKHAVKPKRPTKAELPQHARIILRELKRDYPIAICELTHETPFQLLAATILSAQCTDARVNMVTPNLFAAYPTAATMAVADVSHVEELVRSTGFYGTKAKNLIGMANAVMTRFGGEVPTAIEDLVTLPGVGRKTANVLRSVAFGLPGLPVDTHVLRLSKRLGITKDDDPVKVEHQLNALLPPNEWGEFSLRMILHGRRICDARKPNCAECRLATVCPSRNV